ncbi:DNA cytosine methyltransferase [Rossellomorea marisflavi]|uniref:Cytosine-specific methyltransferase n=1 Tax=Rossellomorea marisflavi TaxID=189381 RepID=A0A5D4S3J9_9BACI|nr:DNA cytosine methyltransferase [Rossellomorea marisflavi]TYS56336.1 DNA cytosine methyltransferase [Rossellomorea marisflavi]
MEKPKVISLFSGAGGMDLGFVNAGFEIVWAIDFEKEACETYKNNLGDHIVCEDISTVNTDDLPDCDIIIGGSPCQGFSNANRKTNFLDNPKNFLVREYLRVVKDKRPKVFVLENVPRLISAGEGKFLKEIKEQLYEYHIEVKVMNAVDHGVAQKRRRAILIGSRIGRVFHPANDSKVKTVSEALENIPKDAPNQSEYRSSRETTIQKIRLIEQGRNAHSLPESYNISPNTHQNVYRRLHPNEPSHTLAHAGKSVMIHPTEDRIISIREAARIQSFPDDFTFYGDLNSKYQQLANAVPPKMAEDIANEIIKYIK